MLFGILLFIFIVVCFLLCAIVLIQSDKGGGLSGALGGFGGASNFLGTQDTANILTRGTAIFAAAFMVLCVLMSFVVSNTTVSGDRSLLQQRAQQEQSHSPSSALRGGLHFDDEQEEIPQEEMLVVPDQAVPVQPAESDEQ